MKIEFYKIKSDDFPFSLEFDSVKLDGLLKRESSSAMSNLIKCKATLSGSTSHICDRCGEDLEINLNEELDLMISDGVCDLETLDAVEFFDGKIDLKELVDSEIESVKSDYHYCERYKNL